MHGPVQSLRCAGGAVQSYRSSYLLKYQPLYLYTHVLSPLGLEMNRSHTSSPMSDVATAFLLSPTTLQGFRRQRVQVSTATSR